MAFLRQEPTGQNRADVDRALGLSEALRSWTSGREARWLRASADLDTDPSDPAKDDADRLNRKQNCGPGKADRRTETAIQLGQLPKTQDALENGAITDERRRSHGTRPSQGRRVGSGRLG